MAIKRATNPTTFNTVLGICIEIVSCIGASFILYFMLDIGVLLACNVHLLSLTVGGSFLLLVRWTILPLFVLWGATNAFERYDSLRERFEIVFVAITAVAVALGIQLVCALIVNTVDVLLLLIIPAAGLVLLIILEPKLWYMTRR